ncbi:protein SUPPRESSOR OF GENE SILENCING 3 [Euphorbia lathyris]|uniref:protein SUPPRESSOR OF GENE SILENCING 3 n=1 Tax=Euphorbia lathyris TaxID=212925 RepID=UPI0033141095
MSSRGRGGKAPNAVSGKGKSSSEDSSPKVENLTQGVSDISLDGSQDDGQWEVISRKSKNKAAQPWGAQNSTPKAWGQPDTVQKLGLRNNGGGGSGKMSNSTWTTQSPEKRPAGRGNNRPQSSNNSMAPVPAIRPPLEHGWNWQARAGATAEKGPEDGQQQDEHFEDNKGNSAEDEDEDDDDADDMDDSDVELMSDGFDSDESVKSYETRKKNKWFKKLFESLDSLTVEQINEPARQWHCPACQGGPGAIDWYKGMQPLIAHAKTKRSKRVRLHRELAELLEEELHRRGTTVVPAGEIFGKWEGLKSEEKDRLIVWPPMVVIMNTKLEKDDNDRWIGMGNQELLKYFEGYAAVRARHSYGPQGHRGMSVLIFESSATGYLEAERLHKHFEEQRTDRNAWDRRRVLFHHGGKRQLYGYMALKEDLDFFNQHSQGKAKLRFEMRSYIESVVQQIAQMSEDNQQLGWYKTRVVKEQLRYRSVKESLERVTDKLRKTTEENRIVRQRTQIHHEQSQEELEFQEQFFKEQMKNIHEATIAKEEDFENMQQREREKAKLLRDNANPSNTEEYKLRVEEGEKLIDVQDKEIEGYVEERDGLMKEHEELFAAMKRRHWEEELELEKQFGEKMSSLMDKYTPKSVEDIVE